MTKFSENISDFFARWQYFFGDKVRVIHLLVSVVLLVVTAILQFGLFRSIGPVEAPALSDPMHLARQAVDYSHIIIPVFYVLFLIGLINLAGRPGIVSITIQSVILMLNVRAFIIFLLPIGQPEGIIAVNDPLLTFISCGHVYSGDLFFSGYMALLFIFGFLSDSQWVKWLLFFGATMIGLLMALMHTHYSIDIVASPFFAYGSYKLALYLNRSSFLRR